MLEAERASRRQQRTDHFKKNLLWFGGWIGSGWVVTFLYLLSGAAAGMLGCAWGINTPATIPCPNKQSLCYQLRLNKSQVLLPDQVNKLLEKYNIPEKKLHQHK